MEYSRWLEKALADTDVAEELKSMDAAQKEDAFYRDLAFGTGGLRGVIGAGTNRMNVYTVAKATQGLANYLRSHFEKPSVAIGYDSRIKSNLFARVAAGVFAANGVQVHIWPVLMPVPTVSFAARYLKTSAGVMITASHNPSKYNGYKVYGPDGCQITTQAAAAVLAEIEKLDIFEDVKTGDFETELKNGNIRYIPDEVYTAFIDEVKAQSVLFGEGVNRDVAIVYSPLNGTGLKPVTRTLKEMGYTNIAVVPEQEQPDGHFPTCPYPNPEIREAMALGMEYAKKTNADLLLATDPDCDRVGIAVRTKAGDYTLFAAVASDGGSSFKVSLDGDDLTDDVAVPAANKSAGDDEQNFDDYGKVKANVTLPAGIHVLRFTATADWFDMDYFNFVEGKDGKDSAPIGDLEGVGGRADVRFGAAVPGRYNVFAATGKFLATIDVVKNGLLETLKNAGFAKGVYMVREVNGGKIIKIQIK